MSLPAVLHSMFHQADEWEVSCPACGADMGVRSPVQLVCPRPEVCLGCGQEVHPVKAVCPFPHEEGLCAS